jgi:PRTRC genetic system protein B
MDLTQSITESYQPEMALVVYKSSSQSNYYLEAHGIDTAGRLHAGRPLRPETISDMVSVFYSERRDRIHVSGIYPENLLHFEALQGGKYRMLWYRPQELRTMFFTKEHKLPSTKMWMPAMIYQVDGKSFNVFAFKGNSRPVEATLLCRAPLMNVNDYGDVCLGDAKVPKPAINTYQSLIQYWEDLLWRSIFSHVNGDNPTKSDLTEVYKRLNKGFKSGLKWSDIDELIETKTTLASLIK